MVVQGSIQPLMTHNGVILITPVLPLRDQSIAPGRHHVAPVGAWPSELLESELRNTRLEIPIRRRSEYLVEEPSLNVSITISRRLPLPL